MSAALQLDPVYCFVYLRISKDDELEGNGVANQLRRCEQTLPANWVIAGIVNENDTSATAKKPRPKFVAMGAALQAGERIKAQSWLKVVVPGVVPTGIMAFAQDRLTRKVREAEDLLDLVDDYATQIAIAGAGVLSLTKGNFDARAAFTSATVNARRETEGVSHRVTTNCEGRALKGKPQGRVPFGYRRYPVTDKKTGHVLLDHKGRIKEKKDEIHEPEAAVIRFAVESALAGKSLRSITAEIDAGEIRPVGGGRWDVRHIRRILTMPTYAGLRVYSSKTRKVAKHVVGEAIWPAIITRAEHEQLIRLMSNRRGGNVGQGRPARWLLSGIAHCESCGPGSRIAAQYDPRGSRNATSMYRCVFGSAEHPGCGATVPLIEADAYVAELISSQLGDPKLGEPSADVADRIDALNAEITKIKAEMAMIAADDHDYEIEKIMLDKRKAKIRAIDDQIAELLPQVHQHTQLEWDAADIEGKRTIIRAQIKSIELRPRRVLDGRRRIFTPDQIKIDWRNAA